MRLQYETCKLTGGLYSARMHAWQENRLGQKFVVDAVLQCDLESAGLTDDLEHTVNYAAVYKCASLLRQCSSSSEMEEMQGCLGAVGAASTCCARQTEPHCPEHAPMQLFCDRRRRPGRGTLL